ncbi:uncharacterized protein LOC123865794 [Maniola jurtina]|uniref:uncharacterized protein LOC123865794 n=1 Tax=Maniola jurtina TaxID=191418 RepID=UPI001E68D2A1|nr:uncharacterized protein LOC123865794 [Maniola jurtina]
MAGMPLLGNSVGAGELREDASNRSSSSGSRRGSSPPKGQEVDVSDHRPDLSTSLPSRRPTSYEREYKVPTVASLSGANVVTHTAPSYEEQRASPALLCRNTGGTPGGRSVRDDGYCSAGSTPRAFEHKSTKGSVVTLSCYKKEPKVQIEEEVYFSESSKRVRGNSVAKTEINDGRETWGTGADFLLSIIGFAVDLANVWRFPYLCYRNGGGAFLIPYMLMLIFGAVPLFYMELILGQYNRQGPVTIWKICPLFKGVGFCAVMVAFYVSFYYNVIIGWALYFLVSSARSELPWLHCDNSWNTEQCWDAARLNATNRTDIPYQGPLSHFTPASEFFHRAVLEMQYSEGLNDLGLPKWQLALCLGVVYLTLYLSLFKGVKSSGKVVWLTATMPYVVLSILLARGLLLPGATRGIAYYLHPELSRLKDTQVWVDAAVQIFYSVGAGFGVHLSYASYNTFHNNCYRDCLVTTLVNCFTSFFSGFVIFTYLGFMSHKQGVPISSVATEGPGLVFQVYPEAVATLPGASLWAMLFFFMLIMLGLDSGMGGLECVITGLLDQARASGAHWLRREHFTLLVVCVSFCVACINITPGGIYMFHLLDTYAAGISLLCSALFEAVAVSWFYGLKRFSDDVEEMLGFRPGLYWRICWKFVSPVFIIGVVVFGLLYQQPLQYQHYTYPQWAVVLGWGLACSSILMIPIVAIYKIVSTPGTCRQRLACCISPESEHEAIRGGAPVSRFTWKHWLYVVTMSERESMGVMPPIPVGSGPQDPRSQLLQEMRDQNYDLIRFASYRTACKLRFVQKKCNLHAIDIWNVIEAFRENALNTLEPTACVNVTRLETLVSSLYHNLNKRLPPANQVSVEACSALLLNWLLSAYSTGENVGKIRVFSIKVALATMCAGKLMDKLRYIFSQLSDGNGHLLMKRLSDYLREVLALPAAVYESPSFSYNDNLAISIFNQNVKITVNDFLDTLMSDPGPPCLVWLPLLHRLASVENVVHPLACSVCRRGSLTGFRYRCTRCAGYTLCQDCFWRGHVTPPHTNDHEVKEYATYKSPSKQIGATLRKSFRCVPERARPQLPRYPDQPERTLNLSHIVPPSPVPVHNGFPEYVGGYVNTGSLDSRSSRSTHRSIAEHLSRGVDDEHRLIARYAARLAHENRTMPRAGRSASLTPELGRSSSEGSEVDAARQQRELISQLEAKNREIMREIARLRQQEAEAVGGGSCPGSAPPLVSELRALRQRKDELEGHLSSLQESRKHLMHQLEGLMRMLKTQQSSPRSTPNSSPRSTKSPPLPGSQPQPSAPEREPAPRGTVRSAPQTPSLGERERIDMTHSLGAMESMGGDARSFHQNQRPTTMGIDNRNLRSDLLYAADSVTNAMSTLVRELNSEGSDTEDTVKGGLEARKRRDFEEDEDSDEPMPRPQLPRHYLHDNNVQDTPPPLPARTGHYFPRT